MRTDRSYISLTKGIDKELLAILKRDLDRFRSGKAKVIRGKETANHKGQRLVA